MSATASAIIAKAASEIKFREGRNNDTKYGAWYGLNHEPWCDMFISWCAASVGATDIVGRFASCRYHLAWFQQRGQAGSTARRGAIVFYPVGGVANHVGIVEAVLPNGYMQTLEGNTSSGLNGSQTNGDGVYRRIRKQSAAMGFGYPSYAPESAQAPAPSKPAPAPSKPAPAARPRVSVSALVAAARADGRRPQGQGTPGSTDDTIIVERALNREGLLTASLVDGSFGTSSITAYRGWQTRCGYKGRDADGIPGLASLGRLGSKYGFDVVG